MRRRATVVFVALSLSATMVAAATASPAGAASCSGDSCSGRDPQASGCSSDAYTAYSTNLGSAQLQLRWSPSCQTNWARLIVYPQGWGCFIYGQLSAVQDTGYMQWSEAPWTCGSGGATYWSPMSYSPAHRVKAELCGLDRCGPLAGYLFDTASG
jgi:Protein of unknown function (DUF2690)